MLSEEMARHVRATFSTFTTGYLTFALECTDFPYSARQRNVGATHFLRVMAAPVVSRRWLRKSGVGRSGRYTKSKTRVMYHLYDERDLSSRPFHDFDALANLPNLVTNESLSIILPTTKHTLTWRNDCRM
ncbi:unnamed protein product [Alternaria burnsii]|nr:unnamed protein product [Alternaria burnsii]